MFSYRKRVRIWKMKERSLEIKVVDERGRVCASQKISVNKTSQKAFSWEELKELDRQASEELKAVLFMVRHVLAGLKKIK